MEIKNNPNFDIQNRSAAAAETAGTIAKKEPELFKKVDDAPETTGSMGYTETAGVVAMAPVSETAGSIASATTSGGSSSGGSMNTMA